ncbi:hypothetical protein FDG2_0895 [Candidatus Protofrankia californiensis]|uniref:Uncharacterized protein n=1 Tax=Candidatus Protofrankia californiensis TaxID=1839754 RepID=A0A1C3NUH8_9ACTN|nr:hypothetical protein FDG2_0895 [Candidatus Protofrankia californiensis]
MHQSSVSGGVRAPKRVTPLRPATIPSGELACGTWVSAGSGFTDLPERLCLDDDAAAFEGAAEGDLVRPFQIPAHGQAAGQTGDLQTHGSDLASQI